MLNILAARHAGVVEGLARGRTALVLDHDGTLVPLARDRRRAALPAATVRLLATVAAAFPTAILTGRTRADVMRLAPVPGLSMVVGCHGAEWPEGLARVPRPSARTTQRVAAWEAALRAVLPPGLQVENKGPTLTVHGAALAASAALRREIGALAAALPGARLVPGRTGVNVVPAGSPDKADAVLLLRRLLRVEHVVFVGDDATDERALALAGPEVVGVRVGRTRRSQARWHVGHQPDTLTLLGRLLAAREGATPGGRRARTRDAW